MLRRLLKDTITRQTGTARDVYGDQTLGAAESVKCRLERFGEVVASQTGDEVRATWKFATLTEIAFSDRITIEGTVYRPVQINRADTFSGRGPLYEVVV